jgi:hypothetical protein
MRAAHKAPRNILIGHAYYTVKYDKSLNANAGALGVTGTETQQIHLDPQMGPDVERETLLHECLHGCWYQTLLDRQYRDKQEEDIIYTMAPKILELLRSNPELVEFLLESGG